MLTLTCPICGRTLELERYRDAAHRPFCSERCRLIDLAAWFNEEYRIETPLRDESTDHPPMLRNRPGQSS